MDVVLRAVVVFVFLLFLMRVVGRRELSSLEPFDLVLLIVIGDLVQQGVTQSDHSLTGAMLSAGTFGVLVVVVSYLSFRFRRLRPVIEGEPMIVVQDGKPVERNLRRERITLEELAASARKQQIASLEEVEWAVLETGGQISFIRKPRAGR
jgi:uncharacterized membrane protein YcaP (DUF421 family)